MTLALSQKDKCLLIGLLGGLFLFVAWYFVYTPLQEKTTTMEMENVELKAKADYVCDLTHEEDAVAYVIEKFGFTEE